MEFLEFRKEVEEEVISTIYKNIAEEGVISTIYEKIAGFRLLIVYTLVKKNAFLQIFATLHEIFQKTLETTTLHTTNIAKC